ncbi:MAG: hypothetical protein MUC72_07855 [Acidobacteria bacterium]|jgi:hypothetical protein|nr:hypothetical protein [Acidobacteriota bacterium]
MRKQARRALLVLHLLFMGATVHFAFMTGNLTVNLGIAALILVILANLAVGRRKALTVACCALLLLLAAYYLALLGAISLTGLPAAMLRPLFIALALLALLEIATIVFVVRSPGRGNPAD